MYVWKKTRSNLGCPLSYSSLFTIPKAFPSQRQVDHCIPLIFQKQEIEAQVQQMLDNCIIKHNWSVFSSSVLLARNKDGTWHFCMNYRAFNAIRIKQHFSILAIDKLLDELYGTKWLCKIYLFFGYHLIKMRIDDILKTTFRTHQGHYDFLVMSFGLCNTPSMFQSTMNMIFEPYLQLFVHI